MNTQQTIDSIQAKLDECREILNRCTVTRGTPQGTEETAPAYAVEQN